MILETSKGTKDKATKALAKGVPVKVITGREDEIKNS